MLWTCRSIVCLALVALCIPGLLLVAGHHRQVALLEDDVEILNHGLFMYLLPIAYAVVVFFVYGRFHFFQFRFLFG